MPTTPALGPADPAVHVHTVRIEEEIDLLEHVPAHVTAAWLRHGEGMIGIGTAWECSTSGPERFTRASDRFRELAARAEVVDEVHTRGSGLVCFGSFSYAAHSARPSRLVVPRTVLGVHDGEAFLTTVTVQGAASDLDDPDARDVLTRFTGQDAEPGAVVEITPDHRSEDYQDLVSEVVARIHGGQAGKVVLSESSTVTTDRDVSAAQLVGRLARAYPTTWVYHLDDVVGASPEMLADTRDRRVFSRVLAGSRPVADGTELDASDREAFRDDAKERAEHAYAIESVLERLTPLTASLTSSPEPFVLRLPGLEHLASDVTGLLREGIGSLEVAGTLHPSAAVSGTPRDAADAIIADLEPRDRGGYASPVGWMDADGDGQWAIALRMAHIESPRRLRVQAGGGLVAASDPVVEHAEVLAKCRPMLKALRAQ
jgi:menaquinone-specific isochorismate synthase